MAPNHSAIAQQTADGRLQMLTDAAKQFSIHLENVPGAVLTPAQRLFVVHEARTALFCTGCVAHQNTTDGVCFIPPVSDVYKTLVSNIRHDESTKNNDGDHEKDFYVQNLINETVSSNGCGERNEHGDELKLVGCLRGIVHSIVNFQSFLNVGWYRDAVQALKCSGIISELKLNPNDTHKIDDEMKLAPLYSALTEIIVLTAVSYALHVVFLALDCNEPSSSSPPLPKICANGPSKLDFSSFLKGPTIPFDDKILEAAPLLTWKDINTTSKEINLLRDSTVNQLRAILDPMSPSCAIGMAPEDLIMFNDFMTSCYFPVSGVVRCNIVKLKVKSLFFLVYQ